ncbi:hypothetical protein ACAG26_06770 [Mycobacterium sp. pUA109]|uniref:hypothetical protein n=1 Tax=Mycobacterium sp. pUA109 TaxID=3238982 RepID=UPI00351B4AEE
MAETTRYIPDFTAPERIELSEVVLQRWAMNNVSALLEAIEESYRKLHQWMD